ncbi:CTD small phosphatase-like protein 3 [Megalops cyprinoides]|uniref:CTD small phosphatase-like protein 3 n=1 Tax=Megalops cyprinoides TaxID=118141 RepID=UPI00186408C3|nr:CTD small phosphatase-like protein 3 [Megalops cyprinoides]
MILRSRKIPDGPPTIHRRKRFSTRRKTRVANQAKEKGKEGVVSDKAAQYSNGEGEGIPVVQARARRRAAPCEDDKDFMMPAWCRKRNVHFETGDNFSCTNITVQNIYPPAGCFPTPIKYGVTCPEEELISVEQCVFGYDAFSSLQDEEEDDDVFNPYHFIKNIPPQSQQSKPRTRDIPVKTRSTPQATLVLDLDETLVFSSLNVIENAEYTFHTHFQDHEYKVFMILRPHVKEFLQSMSKLFEMFVYTSAKKEYAEKILDTLDPQKKLFRHRLYQEDCACIFGHYVKDLDVLERDLAKTAVVDNAPHAFPYHLMNMIPIKSWDGDPEDKELQKLMPYLEKLSEADDFRQVLKRRTDHLHRLLSED